MINPSPKNDAPLEDEVIRITNIIMEQIGDADVESALTVVCNLAGQLVASLAEGTPSGIKKHSDLLTENIRRAAIAKILYDDAKTRKEKVWH